MIGTDKPTSVEYVFAKQTSEGEASSSQPARRHCSPAQMRSSATCREHVGLELDRAIETVEHGAGCQEIEQVVARAEKEAYDRESRLAEQRAVLEQLAAGLTEARPVTERDFLASDDGVLRMNTRNNAGGSVPISVVSSEAGSHHLRIDLEESRIDTLVTDHGTLRGCNARDEYVRRIVENGRANGLTVSIEDESSAPVTGQPKESAAENRR